MNRRSQLFASLKKEPPHARGDEPQVEAVIRTPGIKWIEPFGARQLPPFPNGYKTRPKLGYDQVLLGNIPPIPTQFGSPATIQEWHAKSGGRASWEANGVSLRNLKFDPSADSTTPQIHDDLLDRQNVMFGVEDPGVEGMADEDFALSDLEHRKAVQTALRRNDPRRFEEQFPVGSIHRVI